MTKTKILLGNLLLLATPAFTFTFDSLDFNFLQDYIQISHEFNSLQDQTHTLKFNSHNFFDIDFQVDLILDIDFDSYQQQSAWDIFSSNSKKNSFISTTLDSNLSIPPDIINPIINFWLEIEPEQKNLLENIGELSFNFPDLSQTSENLDLNLAKILEKNQGLDLGLEFISEVKLEALRPVFTNQFTVKYDTLYEFSGKFEILLDTYSTRNWLNFGINTESVIEIKDLLNPEFNQIFDGSIRIKSKAGGSCQSTEDYLHLNIFETYRAQQDQNITSFIDTFHNIINFPPGCSLQVDLKKGEKIYQSKFVKIDEISGLLSFGQNYTLLYGHNYQDESVDFYHRFYDPLDGPEGRHKFRNFVSIPNLDRIISAFWTLDYFTGEFISYIEVDMYYSNVTVPYPNLSPIYDFLSRNDFVEIFLKKLGFVIYEPYRSQLLEFLLGPNYETIIQEFTAENLVRLSLEKLKEVAEDTSIVDDIYGLSETVSDLWNDIDMDFSWGF